MAKKSGGRPPTGRDDAKPTFERIELHVSPGWTDAIDAAAAELGMNRSAYIRMALVRQMLSQNRQPPPHVL